MSAWRTGLLCILFACCGEPEPAAPACRVAVAAEPAIVVLAFAPAGCALSPPSASPPEQNPSADAGVDAGTVTKCCRLDNARGERLDYKCGTAIDTGYLEGRGYRCWLAQ
jgi:hypothetical protein